MMKTVFFTFLCLAAMMCRVEKVKGQELQVLTEDYKIQKDSCKVYAYSLVDYLKGLGFCEGKGSLQQEKGVIDLVRKKLHVNGIDFSQGYSFILELKYSDLIGELERYYGEFGIIEVGFETEKKANEVFVKAAQASKQAALRIPVLIAPFRCAKAAKSILFVYATNVNYEKYMHALKDWEPIKKD